ncbi:hypothetical protein Nepgr_000871 [Nepenthes gracilis]|uniref:gibberellin 3beta-dioxygenase n=1 Tax=Nepenthes gracilis TaxID=150966 RepID=A0AAD3P7J6_NEPGR|nr:hypothetical protein Nepgr_000871 [Nepenthes gracilis]
MDALSEVYKDHPLSLHEITPFDFNSVQLPVPDSHAWPPSSHPVVSPNEQLSSIPVVDLRDHDAVEVIRRGCETWGVFQVVNHGVTQQLVEEVESQTRRLFSLPLRQKMAALRTPGGSTGYGVARITPFFSKLMWHEGFTIIGSSADHAGKLWPDDYLGFCNVMDEYQKRMKILAEELLSLILKSLNIPQGRVNWGDLTGEAEGPTMALQLNSYPTCPDPTQTIGLAPHTDSFLFTILHQSDSDGLQIFKDGVGWVPVDPVPGALVVNIGDLLHIISNGQFPSVLHRAVTNRTMHRVSVAYFYGPPMDFQLSPVVNSSHECPCYRSLKVKEYISIRSKHLDRALSMIRI